MWIPDTPDKAAADRLRDQVYRSETTNQTWSPFDNCYPTVQARIDIPGTMQYESVLSTGQHDDVVDQDSPWIMYAVDEFGNQKTVGGDEFYVTYTDNRATSIAPLFTTFANISSAKPSLPENGVPATLVAKVSRAWR